MLAETLLSSALVLLLIAAPLAEIARRSAQITAAYREYLMLLDGIDWSAGERGAARCDELRVGAYSALICRKESAELGALRFGAAL